MKYQFPVISHLDQVKKVVEGNPAFVVVDKGDYTVVNYVLGIDSTFPPVDPIVYEHEGGAPEPSNVTPEDAAILRECRGITFCSKTGVVKSRKFHKFFNLDERMETKREILDFNQSHWIMDKLDGSMITPLQMNDGSIRWCTKMGITDVAMQAEVFVAKNPQYTKFAEFMIRKHLTPIFEWCSNKQRIVISHEKDNLILLAIRENFSGLYFEPDDSYAITGDWGIPHVEFFEGTREIEAFVEKTRGETDIEGYVVRFANGHMVKVKSDWYVRLHRTKDAISTERRVFDLIVNENIDDLYPLMDDEDVKKVQNYAQEVGWSLVTAAEKALDIVQFNLFNNVDRKSFALNQMPSLPPLLAALCFKIWDNPNSDQAFALQLVMTSAKKAAQSNKGFDNFKKSFFPDVEYKGLWD